MQHDKKCKIEISVPMGQFLCIFLIFYTLLVPNYDLLVGRNMSL